MSDRYYYHYYHNRHHQETRGGTSVFVAPCTVFPARQWSRPAAHTGRTHPGRRAAADSTCAAVDVVFIKLCFFRSLFYVVISRLKFLAAGLACSSSPSTGGPKFAEVLDSILPPSPWASCGCRKVEFWGVQVRPAALLISLRCLLLTPLPRTNLFLHLHISLISDWVEIDVTLFYKPISFI